VNVALDIAARHQLTDLQAELWMVMGVALKERASLLYPLQSLSSAPELQQSLEAYEKSLEFFAKKGSNKKLKSIILNNRGLLFWLLRDHERAYRDLWESLELRTSLLDDMGRATVLGNLALLILGSNESEEFLLEALSIYDRFGHKIGRCQITHDLAGVHMTRLKRLSKFQLVQHRREYQRARNYLQESLRLAEELRAPVKIKQAQHNLKVLESLS
jgi:tetratricopeptide (TPR) repeat protein